VDANAVTTLGVPPLVQLGGAVVVEAAVLTPFALARRAEMPAVAGAPLGRVRDRGAVSAGLCARALRPADRAVALVAPARELSIVDRQRHRVARAARAEAAASAHGCRDRARRVFALAVA